ncbi:MAG: pectate lyase [Bacteroidetes bacterium]|nr:pectate lyase [Bacteroidota bacterium]
MTKRLSYYSLSLLILLLSQQALLAQKQAKPVLPLYVEKGKLVYTPDSLGNRIPDFSYCGYKASEETIPDVPVKVAVPYKAGDATLRIQAAIDYVSKLPLDANGFRGAVLLLPGKHQVYGQLKIAASGVVLRGSGIGEKGTQLISAGTDRATLIRIVGVNDKQVQQEEKITDAYVPVNASSFSVNNASSYHPGDHIIIHRPSTLNWIHEIGTYHFGGGITALGWKPGERDLYFDRMITSVNNNTITIDAPITTALDTTYGGGTISKYIWNGRINNVGVENLQLISAYDKSNIKDEEHCWMAITIENAEDAWVRQVNFLHFAGSAVMVLETAKRVTVEDCISQEPISEIGGERRNTFYTAGQQTLFQRCVAYDGMHDFATGYCSPGPNAFVQCESDLPHEFSGAIDSWSSGILFDVVNVDGNALRFGNRGQDGQGAGWAAANSVFWNCSAARIDCYKPPTAQNYSFGSWSQFAGDGFWAESNNSINPRSLFYEQLSERLHKNTDAQSRLLDIGTEASSSPTVEVAAELTKEAYKPRILLKDWIAQAAQKNPVSVRYSGVKTIDEIGIPKQAVIVQAPALQIKNGWLVRGDMIQTGGRADVPWWSGGIHANDLKNAKPAITRYVPGRTGRGYTDDLNEVANNMIATNTIGIEQHYALWYERRRDDHERIRRMDGDVWPPFYELPFERTGISTAWDGLSKYDLTKYNKWYWSRLKQFADLADEKGLVLIQQQYFQHNIIEAGAHYVDFPWRTANNINNVGFPEPVNFAGDKRIFFAAQFYDTTNAVRRPLHKKFIWQCLDNFKNNNGVIQLIGEEFTGPLHFVQFWTDAVDSWERANKKKEIIGLSVTKDVQDAILADKKRSAIMDVIDIRYWYYQADGSAYAPKGGESLAPRQHARLLKPRKTSFEQVYRAVKEYRQKFPAKAVIYSADSFDQYGWAVFMGGGSLPVLPSTTDKNFLLAAESMKPVDGIGDYVLAAKNSLIAYGDKGKLELDLSGYNGNFKVNFIGLRDGKLQKDVSEVEGGKKLTINLPSEAGIVWLTK